MTPQSEPSEIEPRAKIREIVPLELELIDVCHDRRNLGDMEALASSMRQYGLQQPILITAKGSKTGRFMVVDGRRRVEAARLLGWTTIRAILLLPEQVPADLSLIMNTHRLNLNPVELYEIAVKVTGGNLPRDPNAIKPEKLKEVAAKLNTDIGTAKRILNIGRLHVLVKAAVLEERISLKAALLSIGLGERDVAKFVAFCESERPSTKEILEWLHTVSGFYERNARDLDRAAFSNLDCRACPHRGRRDASLFEDPAGRDDRDKSYCWNPKCYDEKTDAAMTRVIADFTKKTGIAGIARPKSCDLDLIHYGLVEFSTAKKRDAAVCKSCNKLTIGRLFNNRLAVLCPRNCPNVAVFKTLGVSVKNKDQGSLSEKVDSEAKAARRINAPEKWTRKDKIGYLEEKFPLAVRKAMIDCLLVLAGNKGIAFKPDATPSDTKRILFAIGCLAHRNPFQAIWPDGYHPKRNRDTCRLIVRELDLIAVANANLDDLARYIRGLDRAGITPEDVDEMAALVYGHEHWCHDHYDEIRQRLPARAKRILDEVKPWKPDWASARKP